MMRDIDILLARTGIALGSLALVEKELLCLREGLTFLCENVTVENNRGEEEKSDTDFFISPPLSAYDEGS